MHKTFIRNSSIIFGGICFAIFLAYVESEMPNIVRILAPTADAGEESSATSTISTAHPLLAPHVALAETTGASPINTPEVVAPEQAEAREDVRMQKLALVPVPKKMQTTPAPEPEPVPEPAPQAPAHVSELPARLRIPSIGLNSPVIEVGVIPNGEMDVPSGKTNNVGWFKYGTRPGDRGSAVMDAHVYAAFSKLKDVKIGDIVKVETESGRTLTYRITDARTYRKEAVPMDYIFTRSDGSFLNFITCAGTFIKSEDTYSHRLVVYAELID